MFRVKKENKHGGWSDVNNVIAMTEAHVLNADSVLVADPGTQDPDPTGG